MKKNFMMLCLLAAAMQSCGDKQKSAETTEAEAPAQEQAEAKAEEGVTAGAQAPDFNYKDISGKEVSLKTFQGKYVVLDFWGIWCKWCVKGIPDMKKYYDMYKEKFPRLWHVVNFTGINLMPTIVVFLAMVPGFLLIEQAALSAVQSDLWTWLGFIVCIGAATLQLVSDTQAHRFRKAHRGEVCTVGLWNRSRHPNYLGEILMWWSVGLAVIFAAPKAWHLLAGALANTVLFFAVSIPMADKRQSRKDGFAEYKKQTRMLLPIKK